MIAMLSDAELLSEHLRCVFDDQPAWQALIEDTLVWELPFAPSIGDPSALVGREQITAFVTRFRTVFDDFHFSKVNVRALVEGGAVAEMEASGHIKSSGRVYTQTYIVFLKSQNGKIARLREYFNPAWVASAFGTKIR
jgi:ketosteroid isomerase-like protein